MKGRFGKYIVLGIIVLIIVIVAGFFWGTYNSMVTKSLAVDAQWSQVETQYQRRYDLIPNLVNSVKGLFAQEQAVFSQIADARTKYAGATTTNEKAAATSDVEAALSKLLVIVEAYPNLNSYTTVVNLMDELAGTENRVSVERTRYNDKVLVYNNSIKTFPNNTLAGMFGFGTKEYFKSVSGADQAPVVDFSK